MTKKSIKLIKNITDLQDWRKSTSGSVGFVPTMGALHEGHISLVYESIKQCNATIVSIFVNPTQFSAGEDLEKYPRTLDDDMKLLEAAGVDVLFAPESSEIYGDKNLSTSIIPPAHMTNILCGKSRKNHFSGVATIVSMLLNLVQPDYSFFGQKDAQQLAIIKRIHRDLFLSGEIIGLPIIREKDGLAMSSRNRYLTPKEREIAAELYSVLSNIRQNIVSINGDIDDLLIAGKERLLREGFNKVDYLEIRNENTLEIANKIDNYSKLLAAVHIGTTRLIDNISFIN